MCGGISWPSRCINIIFMHRIQVCFFFSLLVLSTENSALWYQHGPGVQTLAMKWHGSPHVQVVILTFLDVLT
jgi:hypothetical protein